MILGGSTNSGTLTVYALQGNITQTGALDVDGVSSFRTYDDDADILLTNVSNALTGAVTFISDDTNGNNAEDIDFTNSVTVILGGGSNIGTLDVIASSGDITQSAALVVGGASTFRVANGSNITLGSANEFGSQVTFKAGAAGDQTFGNVTFRDDSAVKLDGNADAAGDLFLDASTNGAVGGNLSITADTGDITQGVALAVTGTSTLTTSASNADITLGDTSNALGGNVILSTAGTSGDVTIDNGTTNLSVQGTVNGALALTSGGTIADSATLTVAGTTSATTDVDDKSITLNQLASTGAVTVVTTGGAARYDRK